MADSYESMDLERRKCHWPDTNTIVIIGLIVLVFACCWRRC